MAKEQVDGLRGTCRHLCLGMWTPNLARVVTWSRSELHGLPACSPPFRPGPPWPQLPLKQGDAHPDLRVPWDRTRARASSRGSSRELGRCQTSRQCRPRQGPSHGRHTGFGVNRGPGLGVVALLGPSAHPRPVHPPVTLITLIPVGPSRPPATPPESGHHRAQPRASSQAEPSAGRGEHSRAGPWCSPSPLWPRRTDWLGETWLETETRRQREKPCS